MSERRATRLTHVNLARGFRGGERQTELLIRELAQRGVAQRVVLRRGEPLSARLADVPNLERLPIGKPFVLNVGAVRGAFLHAHDGKGAHFAHAAHRFAGCDYVFTRRVDNEPSNSWLTQSMYRRARGVAVLSRAIDRVLQRRFPGLATVRIPSASGGFQIDRFAAAALRAEYGGDCVVGHVGALDDSQKGQRDLIAAAHRLTASDPGWRFVLVGGGRDEAMLRELAGDNHAIRFTGHVDNVGDHLAAFDLFAFPSVHEGLGSALLDAMHAGLPIVASDVDGIPDIVSHEDNGLLVPPRSPQALAEALQRLRQDASLTTRLANAAAEKSLAYTAAAMADRYLRWYRRLGLDLGVAVPDAADDRELRDDGEQQQ
jgi:glycosyltransferase involved in cell wall biosynthesis